MAGEDLTGGGISWDEQQRRKTAQGVDTAAAKGDAGWHATGTNGGAVVSDQFDKDVDRYRKLGHDATQQGPVALDDRAMNQSRGAQMGALAHLRRQADGSAASSANILAQRANQQAGSMAAQQVAGARGAGAGIAAFSGANANATGQAMAANARNADARAGEISRGQGAFTSGANAMRGQDVTASTANAQLDAENRKLAEQQQQHYERMAFDTRNAEMNAANDAINQNTLANQQERGARAAEKAADLQKIKDVASMGLGGFTGLFSDPRTKANIGSLSSLRRGR
jgi:hypothetical protein